MMKKFYLHSDLEGRTVINLLFLEMILNDLVLVF